MKYLDEFLYEEMTKARKNHLSKKSNSRLSDAKIGLLKARLAAQHLGAIANKTYENFDNEVTDIDATVKCLYSTIRKYKIADEFIDILIEKYVFIAVSDIESDYECFVDEHGDNASVAYLEYKDGMAEEYIEQIRNKFDTLLQDYDEAGKDDRLSFEQKKEGLNNTLKIVADAVPNIEISHLYDIFNDPINPNKPEALKALIKHMDDAGVNYILQDSDGNTFYPFIADLLIAPHLLRKVLDEKKDGIRHAIKAAELLGDMAIFQSDVKDLIAFYGQIKSNQLKAYAVSYLSSKMRKDYSAVRTVARRLYFEAPHTQKNFAPNPFPTPAPIANITKYTSQIAS